MTIVDKILNAQSGASLGNSDFAMFDGILRLSAAGSPGNSASGGQRAFTEFLTHMENLLGKTHPLPVRYRQVYSDQLAAESKS
jgi:hypothetical protein